MRILAKASVVYMISRFYHLIVVVLLMCTVGCGGLRCWWQNGKMLGPNYGRPVVPVAADWIEAGDQSVVIQQEEMADWWRVFNDPTLDELIQAAYQQNLSLRVAGLRVLEARAQRNITAANLFPQSQGAFGQYSHSQLSRNSASSVPGAPITVNDWQTGFDLSWEIDVWGRLRRAIESADAALNAEIESYDDVLVTLIGDVAATYIELRSFDERIRLAEENINIQSESLRIAKIQLDEGEVSELDSEQAKAAVADTRSLIPALKQQRRQAVNRLAVLLGTTPYDLEPLFRDRGTLPNAPNEVIVGIPADLLRRRPDIRAAERSIAIQSAQIGIAEADLYPQFAIGGEIKLNAKDFNDLFNASSLAGTIAPGFRWNILNYGRIKNNILIQELRYQQAIVQYENAVLAANREVEDAMTEFLRSKEQVMELEQSVEATAKAVELVTIQYKEGATDFNRVAVLQANLVQAQDRLVAAQASVAIGLTRVYKGLGGGWQIRYANTYCGNYPLEAIGEAASTTTLEYLPVEATEPPSPASSNILEVQ